MRGKIFERREADLILPLVRRIVVSLRARQRLVGRKESLLAATQDQDERRGLEGTLRRLRAERDDCAKELEELGCVLRDPELGVVECYADVDGRIVYLTWLPGHDRFMFWHPLESSWVERQPLPARELSPARD